MHVAEPTWDFTVKWGSTDWKHYYEWDYCEQKSQNSQSVWRDCFRQESDKFISEGVIKVFVQDTLIRAAVFVVLEIFYGLTSDKSNVT